MNAKSYTTARVANVTTVVDPTSHVIGFVRNGRLIANASAEPTEAFVRVSQRFADVDTLRDVDFYLALNRAIG